MPLNIEFQERVVARWNCAHKLIDGHCFCAFGPVIAEIF